MFLSTGFFLIISFYSSKGVLLEWALARLESAVC